MARITICVAIVIERYISPISGAVVTIAALTGPMSVWSSMAADAISIPCVVKDHVLPICGVVAIGTATVIMRFR